MAQGTYGWKSQHYSESYHQRKLYEAAEKRNIQDVIWAIKNGANCHIIDYNDGTVMHKTLKNPCTQPEDQKNIIKILRIFLSREKIPVNIKCQDGKTVLHLATKHGMLEVMNYLIEHGADLNAADGRGNRIIHYMVEGEFARYLKLTKKSPTPDQCRPFYEESVKFFTWMLTKKIKVDCVNNNFETPLHIAAKRNLLHLMPVLIQHTLDVTLCDNEMKTVLHRFVEDKKRSSITFIKTSCYDKSLAMDILQMMLKKGYSVNALDENENTPLHILACHGEPIEFIEIMLKKITNLSWRNEKGCSILHLIIDNCIDSTLKQHKKESANFVRYLISKGADIHSSNGKGLRPVDLAVMRTNPEILKILFNHEAFLTASYNGGNLLHVLSQQSNEYFSSSIVGELIALLVSKGCDINARNKHGMTPMHLAAQFRRNAISGLVKCRADVNAREFSDRKFTPLQLAVYTNNGYSINTLVSVGAEVNAKDSTGKTALHLSMKYKNNMAEKLLRLGAQVEVEDDDQFLPLHYAIREQHASALAELLKYGADINDINTHLELCFLKDPGYTLYPIVEHWIKLKVVELPVHSSYESYALEDMFTELYEDCLYEVEDLKAYKLGNRISLYDLLHSSWNFRCTYAVNQTFIDLIESTTLQTKFPKYYVVILASYHQAIARRSLLELAKLAWWELTKILLPDICVDRILSFLNNRDLTRIAVRKKK